jgi:8-oxo-dGTP pyrophosphatase MutT (NUDIX family)
MVNGNFIQYCLKIQKVVGDKLPGEEAHLRMAPVNRPFKYIDQYTKDAGVLILLYHKKNEIHTVLIKRPVYNGVHSGQISFPGGKEENSDSNIIDTALRETEEEIGIDKEKHNIIGTLTPLYIPISNIKVHPVISYIPDTPNFKPDKKEVENIIEIKISDLLNPESSITDQNFYENNRMIRAPYFKLGDIKIWGATAMIISEFIEVLESVSPSQ